MAINNDELHYFKFEMKTNVTIKRILLNENIFIFRMNPFVEYDETFFDHFHIRAFYNICK